MYGTFWTPPLFFETNDAKKWRKSIAKSIFGISKPQYVAVWKTRKNAFLINFKQNDEILLEIYWKCAKIPKTFRSDHADPARSENTRWGRAGDTLGTRWGHARDRTNHWSDNFHSQQMLGVKIVWTMVFKNVPKNDQKVSFFAQKRHIVAKNVIFWSIFGTFLKTIDQTIFAPNICF